MKEIDRTTYEVKRVFVRKDYRGKGISKLLMRKVEERGKELQLKKLILETSKHFTEAVGLYQKMGYKTIETTDLMQIIH
jgi:putative acetyltransferase